MKVCCVGGFDHVPGLPEGVKFHVSKATRQGIGRRTVGAGGGEVRGRRGRNVISGMEQCNEPSIRFRPSVGSGTTREPWPPQWILQKPTFFAPPAKQPIALSDSFPCEPTNLKIQLCGPFCVTKVRTYACFLLFMYSPWVLCENLLHILLRSHPRSPRVPRCCSRWEKNSFLSQPKRDRFRMIILSCFFLLSYIFITGVGSGFFYCKGIVKITMKYVIFAQHFLEVWE